MKFKLLAVILAGFILAIISYSKPTSAQSYLCISESAVGFRFNTTSRRWEPSRFDADRRFLIRRPNPNDPRMPSQPVWIWGNFGERFLTGVCPQDFQRYGEISDTVSCTGVGDTLTFNRQSMRFSRVYDGGLIFGSAGGGDSAVYEVGSCSRLE